MLRVERSALLGALKTVLPAAAANGVLAGVRISVTSGGAVLSCTNLDMTISAHLDVGTDDEATAVVPVGLLARVVGALDGAVALSLVDDKLGVEAGETCATLHTYDPSTWPAGRIVEGDPVALDDHDLAVLTRLTPIASDDPKRPAINGLRFAGHEVMVTDSYRGAVATLHADVPGDAVVAASTIRAILKAATAPVELTVDDRNAVFRAGDVTWSTNLIEADYPVSQMRQCMRPESPHHWTIPVAETREALARCMTVANDSTGIPVVLRSDGGKITMTRQADNGSIAATVAAESDWDGTLGFKPVYFGHLLAAAGLDEVTLEIKDEKTWIIVRTDGLTQMLCQVMGQR